MCDEAGTEGVPTDGIIIGHVVDEGFVGRSAKLIEMGGMGNDVSAGSRDFEHL